MITYCIVDKTGSVLYHSNDQDPRADQRRIQYLPLLLINDLVAANSQAAIRYVRSNGNLVVFWERHKLVYLAYCKQGKGSLPPVALMQQHLKVLDSYLRYHFGPQWQLRLKDDVIKSRRSPIHPPLSHAKIHQCLATLPFIHRFSLRTSCLCCVERLFLEDHLYTRLIDALHDTCHGLFPEIKATPAQAMQQKITSIFSNPRRHPSNASSTNSSTSSSSANRSISHPSPPQPIPPPFPHLHHHLHHHHHQPQPSSSQRKWDEQPLGAWHHALVFCREKLVVACGNKDQQPNYPITQELLYFLRNMVVDLTAEQEGQMRPRGDAAATPQTIQRQRSRTLDTADHERRTLYSMSLQSHRSPSTYHASPSSLAAPSTFSSAGTRVGSSGTMIHAAPIAASTSSSPILSSYEVGRSKRASSLFASSTELPFKIQTKASPTQVSPSTTAVPEVSWSNPPPLIHSHLLTRLPRKELSTDDHTLVRLSSSSSSSVASAPPCPDDHPLPPNAKALYTHHVPFHTASSPSLLSSSLPRTLRKAFKDEPTQASIATIGAVPRRRASASTSPMSLSRRASLGAPAEAASIDDDQDKTTMAPGLVKMVRRWVHQGQQRVVMTRICCIPIDQGLTAVLLFADEALPTPGLVNKHTPTPQQQIKQFSQALQLALRDFVSFLLIKEATHFTVLSFAMSYPGLVHFVHMHQGTMVSPRIVDLNDVDKHHEILQNVYQSYNIRPTASVLDECCTSSLAQWHWPSLDLLHRLHTTMLSKAYHTHQQHHDIETKDDVMKQHIHQLLPASLRHHGYDSITLTAGRQVLMAIYFSFIPRDAMWSMHQHLFLDLCRRQPSSALDAA
ncbi:hypothetical protein BC940DRAFT_313401 [Gongronella butleri]|nr:hypothetical protein BC940DRAFT_313401 [Gongronella butleri]